MAETTPRNNLDENGNNIKRSQQEEMHSISGGVDEWMEGLVGEWVHGQRMGGCMDG